VRRARRLRLAAHAVTAVWLLAGLVWARPQVLVAPDAPEAVARVTPVRAEPPEPVETPEASEEPAPEEDEPTPAPEPPPRAAPPPEPAPEPARAAAPTPERVTAGDVARGSALLDGAGAFPALSLGYGAFASFDAYARAMTALGARFVVVRDRAIVGGVDVARGALGPARVDAAFSPRARDYTDEPELAPLARAARERFGEGAVVMMLVPRALDAGLFGGVARALAARGAEPGAFREIRGRYEPAAGGGVRLLLTRAVRRDGRGVPLELVFDLGRVASAASGDAA